MTKRREQAIFLSMSAADFEKWMKKTGKTAVDIASALKIHPITVTRFLDGKRVQRSTLANFERLVAETPDPHKRVG